MSKRQKFVCAGAGDCKMRGGSWGLCMHAIPHYWNADCKPTKCNRTPKKAICEPTGKTPKNM